MTTPTPKPRGRNGGRPKGPIRTAVLTVRLPVQDIAAIHAARGSESLRDHIRRKLGLATIYAPK